MKRLLIALLIFGAADLETYNGQYYSDFAVELSTIRKKDWQNTHFLVDVAKGNMSAVKRKLATLSPAKQKLLVHAKDKHGMTPLMIAAMNGQPKMVTLFIKKGADLTETNDASVNPLEALTFLIQEYEKYLKNPRTKKALVEKAWKFAPSDGGIVSQT